MDKCSMYLITLSQELCLILSTNLNVQKIHQSSKLTENLKANNLKT
jgi:hypothetical protein